MTSFPAPPSPSEGGFSKNRCVTAREEGRLLTTCVCEIQAAFTMLGDPAKKERARWHPDGFRGCRVYSFGAVARIVYDVVEKNQLAEW